MTTTTATPNLYLRLRESRLADAGVRAVRRTINVVVERSLNIDTRVPPGNEPSGGGHFGDSHYYDALDYPLLWDCLRAMRLGPDDVAFEIGCGLGRALCAMARWPVKRCVGVELSEALAAGARENVARMRGRRAPVEVIAGDAAFIDYREGTAFYLFNPFGATTVVAWLDRLGESLRANPRPIRILYVNPVHEDVFEATPWLRRSRVLRWRLYRTHASLWENRRPDGTHDDDGRREAE